MSNELQPQLAMGCKGSEIALATVSEEGCGIGAEEAAPTSSSLELELECLLPDA